MKNPADYAAPVLCVDKVQEITKSSIRIAKAIAGNEPFFAGHYPSYPIFPGVFIFEAIHQAVRRYSMEQLPEYRPPRLPHLRSIRFSSPLVPGDHMEVSCQFKTGLDGKTLLVDAQCTRDGAVAIAQAKLQYALEI